MKKKVYIAPWNWTTLVQFQSNVMSAGTVDSISDNGLPKLESDDSTLDWIDN